uniref:Uncharacterized protein n=1 Tax=Siphoviridae sp. ctCsv15 TaxID=2826195 RepID=A0A8S5LZ59_9CAUD|nr:MAG TPA: hypothetical protein [Siphoviridae sp. ctCsv15]
MRFSPLLNRENCSILPFRGLFGGCKRQMLILLDFRKSSPLPCVQIF